MVCFSFSSGWVFSRVGFHQCFSSGCILARVGFHYGFSSGWAYSTGWAFIRVGIFIRVGFHQGFHCTDIYSFFVTMVLGRFKYLFL